MINTIKQTELASQERVFFHQLFSPAREEFPRSHFHHLWFASTWSFESSSWFIHHQHRINNNKFRTTIMNQYSPHHWRTCNSCKSFKSWIRIAQQHHVRSLQRNTYDELKNNAKHKRELEAISRRKEEERNEPGNYFAVAVTPNFSEVHAKTTLCLN